MLTHLPAAPADGLWYKREQRTAATKPTTDDDDETRDVDGGGNRTTTSSNLHPDDTTLDVESLVSKRSFQVKAGSLVLTTVFYLLLCSVIPLIAILFPWILIPGFIRSMPLQYVMGGAYLASYIAYIWLIRRNDVTSSVEAGEEAYFVRLLGRPIFVSAQIVVSIAALYFGSTLLVHSISQISAPNPGSALSLSILLIPIATAIPETIASMIWAFTGKNDLAIGALVGENVLYATFYPGLSLLLVPWSLNTTAAIGILGTALASGMYYFFVRNGRIPVYVMALGLAFFVIYIVSLTVVM